LFIQYLFKAKSNYTQSCYYQFKTDNNPNQTITKVDRKKYLDSALSFSFKASYIYKNVKKLDKCF